MPSLRTALLLSLPALLGAPGPGAPTDGGPGGFQVRSGRVASVDWGDRRLSLLSAGGRLEMGFDRNTVVYLPGHLGTMRDVIPGAEARAAVGPDGMAAWIEVRPPASDGGTPARPDGGPGGSPDGGVPRPDGGVPR